MRGLALCILSLLAASDSLRCEVHPGGLVPANGTVTVRCHVPSDADNRLLQGGLMGYTSTDRQLDGDMAPRTIDLPFSHIPCGVDTAYCMVVKQSGRATTVRANIEVGGCN